MKSYLQILFIYTIIVLIQSTPIPPIIIEGFYWKTQKQYTHQQRRSLISILPKGSVYIHMPQIISTLNPWSHSELIEWQKTKDYCIKLRIELIIGIRTMFINDIIDTISKIETKIKQLNVPFILGWDDCPGGLTDSQKRLQLQIIKKLSVKPWAVVPAAYYSQDGTIYKWMNGLSILNDADQTIPFVLTSKNGINPSSLDPLADFPPLQRKMIFWDNWMAVDSLTRFPRNLPRKRSYKLFDSDFPFGYMLNLCFPPQRIIHGISSIVYQQQGLQYDYVAIANIWTKYLIDHGFITLSDATEMEGALYELMYHYDGTMSVKELIKQYPILGTFLYQSQDIKKFTLNG